MPNPTHILHIFYLNRGHPSLTKNGKKYRSHLELLSYGHLNYQPFITKFKEKNEYQRIQKFMGTSDLVLIIINTV